MIGASPCGRWILGNHQADEQKHLTVLGALDSLLRQISLLMLDRQQKESINQCVQVTLDGRSDALSSASLDGDLGDDGADSACSSGILGFLMGGGGSCSGLVRHRSAGLLPLEEEEEKAPASWGRRFFALASASWSSRWTDVHSALRHPVPISLSLSPQQEKKKLNEKKEGAPASALILIRTTGCC
jgi:hypothetical protein